MATGAEHYQLAESCLLAARETWPLREETVALLAEAQVHATLALADATASAAEGSGVILRGYGDES